MWINLIGRLGVLSLAFCSLPQVIHTISTGEAASFAWGFLFLWGFGELLTGIYTYKKFGWNVLMWNYIINTIFIAIIAWYKI